MSDQKVMVFLFFIVLNSKFKNVKKALDVEQNVKGHMWTQNVGPKNIDFPCVFLCFWNGNSKMLKKH